MFLRVWDIREGGKLPKPLMALKWVLFPLSTWCLKNGPVRYDLSRDTFTIMGVSYSGALFEAWGRDGIPEGTIFRLLRREDGMVTIQTLMEVIPVRFEVRQGKQGED